MAYAPLVLGYKFVMIVVFNMFAMDTFMEN